MARHDSRLKKAEALTGLNEPPPCSLCATRSKFLMAAEYFDPITREPYLIEDRHPCDPGPTVFLPDPPNPPCPECGKRAFLIETRCTKKIYRPRDADEDWSPDWGTLTEDRDPGGPVRPLFELTGE